MIVKIIILALYALIIIIVGIIGLRKTSSFNDFFLGGGKVGAIMSAFSYGATYFSAVVFIGFAGKIGWGFGYSGMWIGIFNGLIGTLAVWALLGWKVKKMSTEMGVHTLSEYLEKRYESPMLKLICFYCHFYFPDPLLCCSLYWSFLPVRILFRRDGILACRRFHGGFHCGIYCLRRI